MHSLAHVIVTPDSQNSQNQKDKMRAHLHILDPPHLKHLLWSDTDGFLLNTRTDSKCFQRVFIKRALVPILQWYANCWISPKWDVFASTKRYFKDSNLEAGHVSCDAPERRVDDHIVGLRHAEVWETERAFEKMAVRARSLCAALTASCLSYQPLSRIWCVISPLIMPLLRSNYFPFNFSQNVQEESIIPNILHLSLSSNINSMYRCEAVLCNSYSAWTTWERNSRQLLFFARTSLSSCSLVLKLCQ